MTDYIEEKYEDLGVRAVRARGFYPVEGMLSGYTGGRIVGVSTEGPDNDETWSVRWCYDDRVGDWEVWEPDDEEWIDLRDSATVGGLLEVVRAAWGRPNLAVNRVKYGSEYRWTVSGWHGGTMEGVALEATEAEALVAALEAAP